jgi:hypothetical protein
MGTSFISIKDVAIAQFEFRAEDWADRSRRARELALSIDGYEVSPQPSGHISHRPQWVWVEAPTARPERRAHFSRRELRSQPYRGSKMTAS